MKFELQKNQPTTSEIKTSRKALMVLLDVLF